MTTEDSHRADLEAQAKRLNAEYGAAGDDERYAIVVRGTDGKLLVEQRREKRRLWKRLLEGVLFGP